MLPASRVQVRMIGNEAIPVWLGAEDYAWLRALTEDFARLGDRTHREVASFYREPPRVPSPTGKRQMALWTLLNLCAHRRPPLDGARLRNTVTAEAQRARDAGRFDRPAVIASASEALGLQAAETDQHLFSDLPGERLLCLPSKIPDPHSLATRTNLALAQGLLRLASEVTIDLYGGAHAVIRQVHLRRLLCTVRRPESKDVRLHVSGAFSLFRHTTMYGRALASVLPLLSWCKHFKLVARCLIRARTVSVRLQSGDPFDLGDPPREYDSLLEERFAREFLKTSLDWDLVREPEPVEVGDALIFPDFAVVHRRDTSKCFLLEIVGFWTPDYLREKLARLRAMHPTPLVLCIDRKLNCSEGELPEHARILWFQRRIDPRAVLEVIEAEANKIGLGPANIERVRK